MRSLGQLWREFGPHLTFGELQEQSRMAVAGEPSRIPRELTIQLIADFPDDWWRLGRGAHVINDSQSKRCIGIFIPIEDYYQIGEPKDVIDMTYADLDSHARGDFLEYEQRLRKPMGIEIEATPRCRTAETSNDRGASSDADANDRTKAG